MSFAALVLITGTMRLRKRTIASVHLRGRSLRTGREVEAILKGLPPSRDSGLQVGRMLIPSELAYSHMAIVGATGSGKTLLQRLLMQSALPRIGKGFGHRALIYDAKQDVLSVLAGMKLGCPIHIMNPMDVRSVAWDMASDINCPASALQVASILVPESKHDSNPFFSSAARHLVYGALISFIQTPGKRWTLRELLLILRDPELLSDCLAQSEATRFLLQYFQHPATFQNIVSTLLASLAPFEVVAAAWDRAEQVVSLSQWAREESIIVLGNDEANRTAIDAMNRLIFKRISELLLAQEELECFGPGSRHSWLFLDEVREAGRLEGLSRLLTKGRSKGVAVVLGFQDISGLHDAYGKEVAEELVGQCGIKVLLRLNSPDTAAWASRLLGSRELVESRRGHTKDLQGAFPLIGPTGESMSHGVVTRRVVLESEFFDLPATSPRQGLTGYFVSPLTGAFKDHIPGDWISARLRAPDPDTPNLKPRDPSHQYLRPWSKEENNPNHETPAEVSWNH